MHLTRLHIHHVRNLNQIILSPHPQFNIILGKNGSGKTSLLEAIHLLALGRSFRHLRAKIVISHGHETMACYGELKDACENKIPLGIEKNIYGEATYKIAGELCDRLSTFASVLPVQLITPESFTLLLAGPEERRRYLDWGVFHVEHSFASFCQRYLRLLKQRNAALKSGETSSLGVWDKEFVEMGVKITQYRQDYLKNLLPFIQEAGISLLALPLAFHYHQGWAEDYSFEEALNAALSKDQRFGYTSVGPHRAEVVITSEQHPAAQAFSRGQQKLLICALHLAQAQHLWIKLGKKCVYLVDDVTSELDPHNRHRLLSLLHQQNHQVFLTGVEPACLQEIYETFGGEMFHVEHGSLKQLDNLVIP